jgi:hypothetical protein
MRTSSATIDCAQALLASKEDRPLIWALRSHLAQSGGAKAGCFAEGLG